MLRLKPRRQHQTLYRPRSRSRPNASTSSISPQSKLQMLAISLQIPLSNRSAASRNSSRLRNLDCRYRRLRHILLQRLLRLHRTLRQSVPLPAQSFLVGRLPLHSSPVGLKHLVPTTMDSREEQRMRERVQYISFYSGKQASTMCSVCVGQVGMSYRL
jgi:hypothetical protein